MLWKRGVCCRYRALTEPKTTAPSLWPTLCWPIPTFWPSSNVSFFNGRSCVWRWPYWWLQMKTMSTLQTSSTREAPPPCTFVNNSKWHNIHHDRLNETSLIMINGAPSLYSGGPASMNDKIDLVLWWFITSSVCSTWRGARERFFILQRSLGTQALGRGLVKINIDNLKILVGRWKNSSRNIRLENYIW